MNKTAKKYQLDTDVIIYHLRGKKELESEWIKNGAFISLITLGELLYGANKSSNPAKGKRIIRKFIDLFSIEVLSLDESIMNEYAGQRSDLEKKGKRIDNFDLLIGVTAKQHNLVLATNNRKHFLRVAGLEIV